MHEPNLHGGSVLKSGKCPSLPADCAQCRIALQTLRRYMTVHVVRSFDVNVRITELKIAAVRYYSTVGSTTCELACIILKVENELF